MLTRASARGERRAGARVDAVTEGHVLARVDAVDPELVGVVEAARVAVGGAVHHHERGSGRELDAADGAPDARQPELALDRALESEHLLDEVRDELATVTELLLEIGALTEHLERRREQAHRRLLAGDEEVGGDERHVVDVRGRTVGVRRGGQPGHDLVARVAAAVFDVGRELLVEELERPVLQLAALGEVGGARQLRRGTSGGRRRARRAGRRSRAACTGAANSPTNSHRPSAEELVDLAIGERPHELLVLLQPLRRDQPHHAAPAGAVCLGGSNAGSWSLNGSSSRCAR